MIREAGPGDADAVARIYNHYILHTPITFEMEPVTSAEMRARIEKFSRITPFLIYEVAGKVAGYAYASTFRERRAYEHTVETTVYLDPGECGKGIGKKLYSRLIENTAGKFHVLVGVIALPNPASVALHESLGFQKAGHLREVGRKFDQWIDVGYWEKRVGQTQNSPEN
ncbi:MAG: N-acetyltransferase [Spirochaetia bacterium]|nr:N-acetyltransferase [Spirochaetia bacterium]